MSISRRGFVMALSVLPFAGLAGAGVTRRSGTQYLGPVDEIDETDDELYTGYEIVGLTSKHEPTRENRFFYKGEQ